MPENGSQSHVTTNCLASSLTLQVEVDALRICLSLSIEQNEKGRAEKGGGEYAAVELSEELFGSHSPK